MSEHGESATAGPSQPRRRRVHKQRFSRSRTGCLTCRGRRIRCDETHPICERCTELELTCTWPPKVMSGSKSGEPSRQATPTRQSSLADQMGSTQSTPHGAQTAWKPPESDLHLNARTNNLDSTLSTAWTAQNAAALSSLYEFANNDLGMPWNASIQDFITSSGSGSGTGNTAAIQPFYDGANGNGNNAMSDWNSNGALPNGSGSYGQSMALPNSDSLSFNTLLPMFDPSLAFNSTLDPSTTSQWRPNGDCGTPVFPSFAGPYPLSVPLSMPKTINDPIEQVFPSADSKMIFQHVRSKTSSIITALGLKDQKPQNPFMDMALRTILIDTASHTQTAFRHAMLSLGASHVYHQYRISSPSQAQNMRVRTVKSKRKALGFLALSVCDGADHNQAEQTDILLATCLTLCIRNTLCADTMWEENLEFALCHISRRGGPAAILSESTQGHDRRFLCGQLAVADLFSTFTTGDEPTLLGQSAGWWNNIGEQFGEHERYLGISRMMTEHIAKYRIIHAQHLHFKDIGVSPSAMDKALSEAITKSAKALLDKLNQWSSTVNQASDSNMKRIQNGDSAYRHMIEISLSTEVLKVEASTDQIQSSVRSILELCSEMSQEPVSLLWPLLTAGSRCLNEENRNWVRQLFDVFRPHYCQDLETAESILVEQWTRMDCGAGFTDWSVLMREMGKQVCLK